LWPAARALPDGGKFMLEAYQTKKRKKRLLYSGFGKEKKSSEARVR